MTKRSRYGVATWRSMTQASRSRSNFGNRPGMAGSYHQLGMVERHRGQLDAAEARYRKSLEIKEQLGDRSGIARSYHQLGVLYATLPARAGGDPPSAPKSRAIVSPLTVPDS